MTWLDHAHRARAVTAAALLGLVVEGGSSSASAQPCPACGAVTRSSSDRRPAIGFTGDGGGWRCHACQVGGDAIDLVARVLLGQPLRDLDHSGQEQVRAWWASHRAALEEPMTTTTPSTTDYPPIEEVETLWGRCQPVTTDTEVASWLHRRCIDSQMVARMDLARVPPVEGHEWLHGGYPVLLPLFDAEGRMRNTIQRTTDDDEEVKSRSPTAYLRRRLIMADNLARYLLVEAPMPPGYEHTRHLVIAEGEVDYLCAATRPNIAGGLPVAILGIIAGSWSDVYAARIPNNWTVCVATDAGHAGARYANQILKTLAPRIAAGELETLRWHPPKSTT